MKPQAHPATTVLAILLFFVCLVVGKHLLTHYTERAVAPYLAAIIKQDRVLHWL